MKWLSGMILIFVGSILSIAALIAVVPLLLILALIGAVLAIPFFIFVASLALTC